MDRETKGSLWDVLGEVSDRCPSVTFEVVGFVGFDQSWTVELLVRDGTGSPETGVSVDRGEKRLKDCGLWLPTKKKKEGGRRGEPAEETEKGGLQ